MEGETWHWTDTNTLTHHPEKTKLQLVIEYEHRLDYKDDFDPFKNFSRSMFH
jgi:hypothetical protein